MRLSSEIMMASHTIAQRHHRRWVKLANELVRDRGSR